MNPAVLLGNLVAGAVLLAIAAVVSWPLAAIGAVYVIAASVFLAAAYARPVVVLRHELAVWIVPWLAATALCTWVLADVEAGTSSWLLTAWFGLVVSNPFYVVWQVLALAVRQLMSRTAKPTGD